MRVWGAFGILVFAVTAAACSPKERRDQYYGKDVGTTYQGAEASATWDAGGTEDTDAPDAGAEIDAAPDVLDAARDIAHEAG